MHSAPASLQLRRRRHKTVHFGENLLMQVCADRAHLAALGSRAPDVAFCHRARSGLRRGDARFCCIAHHCCLAAGSVAALGAPRVLRQRSADDHEPDTVAPDAIVARKSRHHHHHHRVHSCPLHDARPPEPEQEPEPVRTKTVSPYLFIPRKLEPNVQQLFSFIEGVLSAWAAEEGLTSGGEYSEPDERVVRRRKLHQYRRRTDLLLLRRIAHRAALLPRLGCLRYRHHHWKGTAQTCNEDFLRKVNEDYALYKSI